MLLTCDRNPVCVKKAIAIARNKSCTDEQQQWHNCSLPKTLRLKCSCDVDFAQPETKRRKSLKKCDDSSAGQTKHTDASKLHQSDHEILYAALHWNRAKGCSTFCHKRIFRQFCSKISEV